MGELAKDVEKELREHAAQGLPVEEVVHVAAAEGLTIVECIKLVMGLYGLSLGEANSCVSRCPEYRSAAKAAAAAFDELIDLFEEIREDEL